MRMKTHPQYFISKTRRSSKVGITIGIDLGDIWSHYCTLNEDGEVVDRGRFRTKPMPSLQYLKLIDRRSSTFGRCKPMLPSA